MKLIRVGAAVLNQTPLAWEENLRNIRDAIKQARAASVSVLCMPELCISGYGCEDAFLAPGVHQTALEMLQRIVPETKGMIVSLGLPVMHGGAVFNTACLVVDGKLLGFVGKQNLAGDGIHYEPRWFKPWPNNKVVHIKVGDQQYPLGDLTFSCGDIVIGFEICEDAWVGIRPGAELAQQGVDIILNPSASHFAFGKDEVRRRFVLEGSRAFHVAYVYANLLGNESGRAIYDGDAMIASVGQMLALGPRLSFADCHVTAATIDIDRARMERARTSSFQVFIDNELQHRVRVPFDFPDTDPEPTTPEPRAWELVDTHKEEEFARAVALGLFDYMRKSRSRGFVVSLSGGADSSACAALCYLMVQFGLTELGAKGLASKLAHVAEWSDDETIESMMPHLLTCAYQATQNSSETTRNAAEQLAREVHATYYELDIEELVAGYRGRIETALGRSLTWEQDDITLQNIQARVRSPGIWMFANIQSALLLSTSNRSEAAVGYATMDGDTSGGLSPIAGIDKAFLREWLAWLEKQGPHGHAPLPSLRFVNEQQPTAELRPQGAGQTDEKDLMPYPILDQVERLAIRDKLMPLDILKHLRARLPEYSLHQLSSWVERFFQLWSRNQWKRERYAPSFHLDDENLDPKTWCRFPILSGGFRFELGEMRAWVAAQNEGDQGKNNQES